MTPTNKQSDEALWAQLCAAETAFYDQRMALLKNVSDLALVVGNALEHRPC